MKNELFLWEFSGEEAADLHNPPHPPPPPETAGAARRGSCRGAETPVPRLHRGGLSLPGQTTRRPFMQTNPPHPSPSHLTLAPRTSLFTLTNTQAHLYRHQHTDTYTNAQWTLIEELVYCVCSTSTTVGSRKVDDADKVLVPSHINLITGLAFFFLFHVLFS